jgi:hypothetical protein
LRNFKKRAKLVEHQPNLSSSNMSKSDQNGPYYGITTMRNGVLVGSKGNSTRCRVKRYVLRNPGARIETIAQAMRLTPKATELALDSLKRAGEIYAEPEGVYAKWYAGERRATPTGLLTSIWDLASHMRGA